MIIQTRKLFVLSIILCVTLLAALFLVSPVSADDAPPEDIPVSTQVEVQEQESTSEPDEVDTTPQPTVEPEEEGQALVSKPTIISGESMPTQETTPEGGDATATPEPSPEAGDPTTTPDPTTDPVPSEVSADTSSIEEVVEGLVENDVVLADGSGDPVSLSSQAASDAVTSSDPYFYVGTTKYSFYYWDGVTGADPCAGISNCTWSGTPITSALQYMQTNNVTPTDRKLYIEAGTYNNENIEINGVNAGVSGLTGLVGLGSSPEAVVINGRIYVFNMLNGFSISNMSVYNITDTDSAAIWMEGNTGTIKLTDVITQATGEDSSGIVVIYHTGKVELNRVQSNNNAYHGALINSWFSSTGSVTVTNSEFNGNLQNVNDGIPYDGYYDEYDVYQQDPFYGGLIAHAAGNVTLNGVSANDNIGDGIDAWAGNTLTVKGSVATGNDSGDMIEDYGDGFYLSGDSIVVENVNSDNNNLTGIFAFANLSFTGRNIWVDGNSGTGFYISTCEDWGDDDTYCDNAGAGTVTLTTLAATNNQDGVVVNAKGVITLNDVYAGGNTGYGFYLDNSLASTKQGVNGTLVKSESNGYVGVGIFSRGSVKLNTITANGNGYSGLEIDNTSGKGSVTITSTSPAYNETSGNSGYGYHILATGAVTITNLDAYGNGMDGGNIDNRAATSLAPVTINATVPNWVNAYDENGNTGLTIYSDGSITISKTSASYNAFGAYIHNVEDTGKLTGATVIISDSYFDFNDDEVDPDDIQNEFGLSVYSNAAITLTNVSASENDGPGAILDNYVAGSLEGITINAGTNQGNNFVLNNGDGLTLVTNGAVTLTNVNATGNGGYGLQVTNDTGTAGVTINRTGTWGDNYSDSDYYSMGNSFSYNGYSGLVILSKGSVKVTFQHADYNNDSGLSVTSVGSVKLMGPSSTIWASVKGNNGNIDEYPGLSVVTGGTITLSNIYSSENNDDGINLNNRSGKGNVSLTNISADENGNNGLVIETTGNVSWKNGYALNNHGYGEDNSGYGAYIDNRPNSGSTITGKTVTLSGIESSRNAGTGLFILSKGAVTLTDVDSNNNSRAWGVLESGDYIADNIVDGMDAWYFDGTMSEQVTFNVTSPFFNPTITLYHGAGEVVASISGAANEIVSLVTTLSEEGFYFIEITDDGWGGGQYDLFYYEGTSEPTIWNENSLDAYGIYIDNTESANAPVTITNSSTKWIGNNKSGGAYILSNGAVAIAKADFNDSWADGLFIDNSTATPIAGVTPVTYPGVTLTDVSGYQNIENGINVSSLGAVNVIRANAGSNLDNGITIINNTGTVPASVNITEGYIDSNGNTGLQIISLGKIFLTTVRSYYNGNSGIIINTSGAVTFKGVSASVNNGYGADVNTLSSFTTKKPSSGRNWFNGNLNDGLLVNAGGKITLSTTWASSNGWNDSGDTILANSNGISLNNASNIAGTGAISLTDVDAYYNTDTGLRIETASPVTITDLESSSNISYGAYIDQVVGPSIPKPVTLSKVVVEWNGMDGLYVDAKGNVAVDKISAFDNTSTGVNIVTTGTVTVLNTLGANYAGFNGGVGFNISSNGVAAVTGLEVVGNGSEGLVVINSGATLPANVTMTNIIARNNEGNGIGVISKGVITLNTSFIFGNGFMDGGDGVFLTTTNNNIFINSTYVSGNAHNGIYARTGAANTLKLSKSSYFGNLRDYVAGDRNLNTDGLVVIS